MRISPMCKVKIARYCDIRLESKPVSYSLFPVELERRVSCQVRQLSPDRINFQVWFEYQNRDWWRELRVDIAVICYTYRSITL